MCDGQSISCAMGKRASDSNGLLDHAFLLRQIHLFSCHAPILIAAHYQGQLSCPHPVSRAGMCRSGLP